MTHEQSPPTILELTSTKNMIHETAMGLFTRMPIRQNAKKPILGLDDDILGT
jgi:hypothetical protein